ncbi:amidohydrolase family protein [Microvirga pakistanensis]|uniref:amidohydrolase family protein n=1 Tax=Microvirga pakistanensis TaxID=1682650 RepID=UPI00106A6C29|nr:amidohydrolase family protein [Microvirga pakistanensis]
MRIDAHQHFWRVSRGDYSWMSPDVGVLYRDYSPEDLQPLLARHGIDRTILVQAAPTVAETEFMLQTAEGAPFVAGVVGWVDFAAPDAPSTMARLATHPLIVGFRPMVQDIPDDDWLLRPDLAPAFRNLVERRLVFDALVLPRHLSRALVIADRFPDLSIVVDHGAKPFIREGRLDPWRADMAALAARPNVACKLSGLVTEARADWAVDDLRPYVDHLLDVFGPERLLWGSDWPVANLAGGYDRWLAATLDLIATLSDAERNAILGGNAARIYLTGRGRP